MSSDEQAPIELECSTNVYLRRLDVRSAPNLRSGHVKNFSLINISKSIVLAFSLVRQGYLPNRQSLSLPGVMEGPGIFQSRSALRGTSKTSTSYSQATFNNASFLGECLFYSKVSSRRLFDSACFDWRISVVLDASSLQSCLDSCDAPSPGGATWAI